MSAEATNEWKVGAFIVGGVAFLILGLFWLGASRLNTEVKERVTYFDESVQGLEVGAPIKIRGVTIGRVSKIGLAPDRRLVEVHAEIRVDALRNINAIGSDESISDEGPPPEMRIVVASQGITGVKFLEADFFPADTPKIPLTFKEPDGYVPSAPSTLKSLEDALRGFGEELPLAMRDFRAMAVTLESRLAELDTAALSSSLTGLSDDLRGALNGTSDTGLGPEIRGLVGDLRGAAVSIDEAVKGFSSEEGAVQRAASSFADLATDMRESLARVDELLDTSDVSGTLASVRGAADAATRLSDGLSPAAQSMPEVLRDLRATLRKFESLAALLERDPGVLLRGRSAPTRR